MNFSEAFLISLIAGSKKIAILTIAYFVTFRWFLVARFIRFQRLPRLSEFFDRTETRKSIKTKYHRTSDCTIRMAVYTNEFKIVFDKIKKNKLPECFSNWYLGNVHCDNRNGWVSLLNFELILRFKCQFLFTLRPIIETHSDQRWNRVLVSVIQVWIVKSENNYGHKI